MTTPSATARAAQRWGTEPGTPEPVDPPFRSAWELYDAQVAAEVAAGRRSPLVEARELRELARLLSGGVVVGPEEQGSATPPGTPARRLQVVQ